MTLDIMEEEQEQELAVQNKKPRPRPTFFGNVYGFWAFAIVLVCSILSVMSEPTFGWNEMTARLTVTFLVSFLILNYVGGLIKWLVGRNPGSGIRPRLAARPFYVVLLLVTMLGARVASIDPALVFGMVLILDFSLSSREASVRRPALSALSGVIYAAIIGIASWVSYSFLVSHPIDAFIRWDEIQSPYLFAVSQTQSYVTVAVGEFLSILTIAAIAALPVTLLPFTFLEGSAIWRWSKIVWAAVYMIACAIYSFIILPLPSSWDVLETSFVAWCSLYVLYALLAVVFWAYFRFKKDHSTTGTDTNDSGTSAIASSDELKKNVNNSLE